MHRTVLAALLLLLLASAATAATLATHALVTLVPPVEAALAAPVGPDGRTSWRVSRDDRDPWQVTVEARRLDGSLIEAGPAVPGESSSDGQELTSFVGPTAPRTSDQVVMTLVLCRE